MFVRRGPLVVAGIVLGCCFNASGMAQGKQFTTEDYARAEKFMGYNVNPMVYHGVGRPSWMEDGRFWYRDNGPAGVAVMVVEPAKGTKAPAFDQIKLAAALSAATAGKMKADPNHLVISEITFSDGDKTVVVGNGSRKFRCDLSGAGVCTEVIAAGAKPAEQTGGGRVRNATEVSPDKTKAAFIRDWNLWVRDVATGKETQLTKDGVKDYGYATDNAGWQMSDNPILVWSPDSKKIATFQQDQRKDGEMYLVPVTNGHPVLKAWKYPLVGDKDVTMIERVIIEVDGAKMIRLKMPPDQHRSTLCDDVSCRGGSGWDDVQWSDDGAHLAFVSTSRDHKQEWMRIADASTGEVRDVMGETTAKFYESGNDKVNWKYLSKTNELLWFSEKDNWGQMYLYDIATGKLKNQITHGEGNVTQVLHVDEKTRTIYFLGVGKEPGRDPYFRHYYSIKFDGKDMKLLTPENVDHAITPSPDGHYFVDVYSGPQTGSCGGRGFAAAHGDMQSLAELGFIVVCIDGMGTPWRSKAFHEAYYADLGDNTLPDQVSGMKDLAAKYPWIDLDKVGIYGHSGGGNATGAAMFHYPDFFKVGIAESGNHDQRDYEDDWAEKWAGLEVKNADGTSNYDSQANQNFVKNLKGKLLLAHGSMDNNVPMNNTLLVVEALIKANKDFDLLIIPNVAHGYGEASQYMARRRWDYFVKNLAGDIPPHEYEMKSYASVMAAMRCGPSDGEDEYDEQ